MPCSIHGHGLRSLAIAAVLASCGGPRITQVTGGTGSGGEVSASSGSVATADDTGGPVPTERAVDILFVIDNSGSMGDDQTRLIERIHVLVETLDAASPPVDYRIAVTTTDNGNPWCAGTTPEAGNFEATSCLARSEEFVFPAPQVDPVPDEIPCRPDTCLLPTLDLPQPWVDVERTAGTTNVPDDRVVDTLRCLLPQGILGCGFEQPLESLYKAIRRMEVEGETNYGFRRPGALLAALVLTDEADCSYNPAHETIFLPDGDRVFWSDPGAEAPTSALCWNAGVACTGDGVAYEECHAIDVDENGGVPVDPERDAVLFPVARYLDLLASHGAFVAAINGVDADGSAVYADSPDVEFQGDYGIGPGCETMAGRAVPPVRLREVVEVLGGPGNQHSVCAEDFGPALASFAESIVARLP